MICSVDWCERPVKTKKSGLCQLHYKRQRSGKPMDDPPLSKNAGIVCKNESCSKNAVCKGYCRSCYTRYSRHGDPNKGKRKGVYSGKRRLDKSGYVVYNDPNSIHCQTNGAVLEHRAVMGEFIGRRLLPHESVHHKNGDRSDNRIENLELWSRSQPYGQRVEDKIKWAREILELYGHLEIHKLN